MGGSNNVAGGDTGWPRGVVVWQLLLSSEQQEARRYRLSQYIISIKIANGLYREENWAHCKIMPFLLLSIYYKNKAQKSAQTIEINSSYLACFEKRVGIEKCFVKKLSTQER